MTQACRFLAKRLDLNIGLGVLKVRMDCMSLGQFSLEIPSVRQALGEGERRAEVPSPWGLQAGVGSWHCAASNFGFGTKTTTSLAFAENTGQVRDVIALVFAMPLGNFPLGTAI